MRKISIMALLLVLTLVFTGCARQEIKLYDAFAKSQEITSMESDTNLTFTLDTTNLSAEDQQVMEEVKTMLKDSKISLHQKTLQNEEGTILKSQADTALSLGGMTMDMQIWVEADMSSDTPKFKEIIKMPPILMSASPEFENKEYIVYDLGEMMNKDQSTGINFGEFMNFSKEMQPDLTNFLKDYIAKFELGFEVVEYKGKKTVDGESLDVYELKLDDASLKKLIRYSGNHFMEDKDTLEFLKEYIEAVASIVNTADTDGQAAQEEINQELEKLQSDIPNLKEQFNEFMDTFDGIKVLGDKGIVIEYGVNKDGYIVHENGMIDLRIDLTAIEKSFGEIDANESDASTQGAKLLQIGINYNTNIGNINEDVEIRMPQLNEENSLNFKDFM